MANHGKGLRARHVWESSFNPSPLTCCPVYNNVADSNYHSSDNSTKPQLHFKYRVLVQVQFFTIQTVHTCPQRLFSNQQWRHIVYLPVTWLHHASPKGLGPGAVWVLHLQQTSGSFKNLMEFWNNLYGLIPTTVSNLCFEQNRGISLTF